MDLIEASTSGNLERVKELVSQGADNFDHALILASCNGHLEVVKYLVEQGEDIYINHDFQRIYSDHIREAIMSDNIDIIKYYLSIGYNTDKNRMIQRRGDSGINYLLEQIQELKRQNQELAASFIQNACTIGCINLSVKMVQ